VETVAARRAGYGDGWKAVLRRELKPGYTEDAQRESDNIYFHRSFLPVALLLESRIFATI
jgi:hypothetical protein